MNPSRAIATLSPPRLSTKNSTPASPWKSGNAAPGKFGLLAPSRLSGPRPSVSARGVRLVRSQPFCVPVSCHMCGSWLGLGSFGNGGAAGSPSWSRPLGSSCQSHLWSRFCLPRFCGLDPARVLPCLKLLLVPFCSVNVGPLVCPSRAAPRLTAALAPRPLPLAASSLGARPVRPAPPLRPSLASRLLIPVRLPPGRLAEVVPLAPLRPGVANVTSPAGERDVTPSVRCGAKFSFKTVLGSPC